MIDSLYPLKFHPILKERIWGGNKLAAILSKKTQLDRIGESWEISDVDGEESIVSEGHLKGHSLKQLLHQYKAELLGDKNYKMFGTKFPLLIKFIDAKEALSIQLHPNDALAKERHNSFGKTEMWYVMDAEDDSNLIVGFNKKIDSHIYLDHLANNTLTEILNYDEVKKGDAYFIEVGRIHAIGAGVMLAEIQQTSDITYRIYDWDRVDDEGKSRELHNELALDAIDFDMDDDFRVSYTLETNRSNEVVSCPYFTTNILPIRGALEKENLTDSFLIYMCVEGIVKIETPNYSTYLKKGETLLIPAVIKDFTLASENAKLLEVFV